MPTTKIKICGISSAEIAAIACDAGANAIGLNFYPASPRYLEIEQAREVVKGVKPFVSAVAVMVNPEADYVREIIAISGITHLQFHGEEEEQYCASFGLPFIKVLRVSDNLELARVEAHYPSCCCILLDTHVPDLYGGSGKSFDWRLARYNNTKPVILAGGLTPENIVQAIHTAQPYGVDVSSGVETNGIKDPSKIRSFCANALNLYD